MGSAADNRRSRRPRKRQAGRGPAEPRGNGKLPSPLPVRIQWYRTRVRAKDQSSRRLESWTPVVTLSKTRGAVQTIANDVPIGTAGRGAIEAAVRQALSGLDGRWKACIAPVEAYCVEIESPDGFRCLAFIPNPGRQDRRAVTRRLRDLCRRPQTGSTKWRRAWVLVVEER